jgi:methyl-accepting chemotaxis protein
MTAPGAELESRREFLLRSSARSFAVSASGVVLIALYLAALLRLTPEQWSAFVRVVGGGFAFLFLAVNLTNLRIFEPILRVLDARGQGVSEEALRAAYRRVALLPGLTFGIGEGWWLLGGVGVAGCMRLVSPGFLWSQGLVMVAAAASGGLVAMIFHYFSQKRDLAGLRLALAARIGEPEARAALMPPIGLRAKLLVSVTGVTLVVVVFTLLLADARSRRPLDGVVAASERAYGLELSASGVADDALARAAARARELAAAEVHEVLRAQRLVSLAILVLGAALAVGVSLVVARDVAESTGALARDVERIAAGDLRPALELEGEDELGALARAFERMRAALRSTVGSVAGAADEVDAAAERLAEVSAVVAATTREQVEGIRHAAGSTEAIRSQVEGITASARTLSASVEESSSSLAELGVAGEQLHGTASVLHEKVDTAGASIDRMTESVRRVVASADDLTGAAEETASGLEQMAASMEHVDENAAETARLSERVVDAAERGRERVRETIEGMEAIRGASEAAEAVIRDLARRVESIGTIVSVIDGVADETNLLALNAAIIAAQAGEQGRAFSVVADEIKDLADRVLENTQEIGALIRGVQEESQTAAQAMERGALQVKSGVSLAAEAGVALEEITAAARGSGEHIRGIVSAVKEQAIGSGHILELMERVRSRVDQIRNAGIQHERGNEVVRRNTLAMGEVARQMNETTREQAKGTAAIVRSIERVKDAVAEIHRALEEQSRGSADAAAFLEEVHARTRSHEESAGILSDATGGLLHQARELRESIRRFTL